LICTELITFKMSLFCSKYILNVLINQQDPYHLCHGSLTL